MNKIILKRRALGGGRRCIHHQAGDAYGGVTLMIRNHQAREEQGMNRCLSGLRRRGEKGEEESCFLSFCGRGVFSLGGGIVGGRR